jgi:hypothetical protein
MNGETLDCAFGLLVAVGAGALAWVVEWGELVGLVVLARPLVAARAPAFVVVELVVHLGLPVVRAVDAARCGGPVRWRAVR